MGRAAVLVIGCSLLGLDPAPARDKPVPLPQQRFLGEWVNADKGTRTIKRMEITETNDGWHIEVWYSVSDGTKESSAGKVKLSLHGDSAGAKELPYGFATWETKIATRYLSVKIEKEELVVELFSIFKPEQAKGRSNTRQAEKFKKK